MTELDHHIWDLGFPHWMDVTGRRSIAGLVNAKGRQGVYVLGFANGERYVGRASNVVNRFVQHQLSRPDIVSFTFRPVAAKTIADEERRCIHTLESKGVPLRNLAEMSVVRGERQFDKLVSPEEQEHWLTVWEEPSPYPDPRVVDDDLRRRYTRRFRTFMQQPLANDALWLLGTYVAFAIPFPNRTELTFWSMSCLPQPGVYSRVNINMQEVLTVFDHGEGLIASFHLAKSPIEREWGPDWRESLSNIAPITDHYWKPGGGDQFQLQAPLEFALLLMTDRLFHEAMMTLNLRLMRKGPTYYSTSHCIDLVTEAHAVRERRWDDLKELWELFDALDDPHEDASPGGREST